MNPSSSAIASIQAFVGTLAGGWSSNTDVQILAAIQAAKVANPVTTQPTIPKPYTFADVMGCLSAASVVNIRSLPTSTALITAINARDSVSITNWLGALQAGTPLITSAEATAVLAVVNATEPDPSWTAQVAWDIGTLGRAADVADIHAARIAPGGAA